MLDNETKVIKTFLKKEFQLSNIMAEFAKFIYSSVILEEIAKKNNNDNLNIKIK